jgi:Tol biopolymer transport system component
METGEERELDKLQQAFHLHWSPDGRSILVGHRQKYLSLIDVQTGDVTPITRADHPGPVVWSLDGKTMFYIRYVRVESEGGFYSIVAHDLETGREQELRRDISGGRGFAISPDGRQLAFTDKKGKERVLKVMPAAGGEPRELLRLKDPEVFRWRAGLAWTPDGRYIMFGKHKPDELWRIPSEGGKPQKLLAMDGLRDISIHPDGQRIAFTGGKEATDREASEAWVMENFLPGFTADE